MNAKEAYALATESQPAQIQEALDKVHARVAVVAKTGGFSLRTDATEIGVRALIWTDHVLPKLKEQGYSIMDKGGGHVMLSWRNPA